MICSGRAIHLKELYRFALVGAIGFIVDGGLLTILAQYYGVDLYLARLGSFSVATLVTWSLNRTLVFKRRSDPATLKSVEYGRYLLVQVGGGLANFFIFSLLVASNQALRAIPVIPLFVGAIFGLLINFTGSRFWVFRGRSCRQENHA